MNTNYIGQGTDIHKIQFTFLKSQIVLGGTKIKSHYKIIAHSDGDVVYHSIANAILGSCQAGDIGEHFSDKDKNNKNINSEKILAFALAKLRSKRLKIANIDLTIICQKIYLKNYKQQIMKNIANITGCTKVNVKATRFEKNTNFIQCESIVFVTQI